MIKQDLDIVRIIGDLYEFGIDATYDSTGGGVDYAHVKLGNKFHRYFLWIDKDTIYIVDKRNSENVRVVAKYKNLKELLFIVIIQRDIAEEII
jgi:hypothetical protein